MKFAELIQKRGKGAYIALFIMLFITTFSMMLSRMVQTDFGRVTVKQVRIQGSNGKKIAAKLMIPSGVTDQNPAPGIVYVHGYQNNKETSAPYCIEAARRGFVVLNIDSMGRGKSQAQLDENEAGFDPVYGAGSAWEYLLELPFVDSERSGLMGHSLGAEMVYSVALRDPRVKVLVTSGFAWLDDAGLDHPRNMLMIFGRYDEYRNRMSGTDDFESQWMTSDRVRSSMGVESPEFNIVYGSFSNGTARMVYMPDVTHVRESFDPGSISRSLLWLREALNPDPSYWTDPDKQIWRIKELASLMAMITGIMMLLPLSLILIRTALFRDLQNRREFIYDAGGKDLIRHGSINALLMFLYLPLILVLFGLHVYVVRIDLVFPLMMVNGVLWWFLLTNLAGHGLLKRWILKREEAGQLNREDLGLSVEKSLWKKTFLLAVVLFTAACLLEGILETVFLSDYRYIFPYAGRFTPFRALLFVEYSILFYPGFLQLQRFLFCQLRFSERTHWAASWFADSLKAVLLMVVPILIMLAAQYVPLYLNGTVPFVGPGASLIGFIMNLEHMILLLTLILPVGAWLYRLSGSATAGAMTSSLLVSWFFTSSSVLAPIPV